MSVNRAEQEQKWNPEVAALEHAAQGYRESERYCHTRLRHLINEAALVTADLGSHASDAAQCEAAAAKLRAEAST